MWRKSKCFHFSCAIYIYFHTAEKPPQQPFIENRQYFLHCHVSIKRIYFRDFNLRSSSVYGNAVSRTRLQMLRVHENQIETTALISTSIYSNTRHNMHTHTQTYWGDEAFFAITRHKSQPFSCLLLTIIWPSPLEWSHTHTYERCLLYNKAITIKAVRKGVLSNTAGKLHLTHPSWPYATCKHTDALRSTRHTRTLLRLHLPLRQEISTPAWIKWHDFQLNTKTFTRKLFSVTMQC